VADALSLKAAEYKLPEFHGSSWMGGSMN